jgi:hypothetical protein
MPRQQIEFMKLARLENENFSFDEINSEAQQGHH